MNTKEQLSPTGRPPRDQFLALFEKIDKLQTPFQAKKLATDMLRFFRHGGAYTDIGFELYFAISEIAYCLDLVGGNKAERLQHTKAEITNKLHDELSNNQPMTAWFQQDAVTRQTA